MSSRPWWAGIKAKSGACLGGGYDKYISPSFSFPPLEGGNEKRYRRNDLTIEDQQTEKIRS